MKEENKSSNVKIYGLGFEDGKNSERQKFQEIIDEMIKENEEKKKELVEEEAELIEIVPLIDYIACLKELKNQLKEIK